MERNGTTVYMNALHRGRRIRMDNYNTVKQNYEAVKPISGIRSSLNLRPLTDRSRPYEVWIEQNGNYGAGFHSSHIGPQKIAKSNGVRPLLMFSPDNTLTFTPQWMNSYATWDLLSALLPDGIHFAKKGAKQYFELATPDGGFSYFLSPYQRMPGASIMRFIPYEINGKRYFKVHAEDTVTETKTLVDREVSKQLRQEFEAFKNYYAAMAGLISTEVSLADEFKFGESHGKHKSRDFLKLTDWLKRAEGEEIGSRWADAVRAFYIINSNTESRYDYEMQTTTRVYAHATVEDLNKLSTKDFYKYTRPYKDVLMPLGVSFWGNGR